jgi:ACT domain-containing protein
MREVIMKAIVTVIGGDQVGIIAAISNVLAENNVNIEDVNQTIMGKNFTMMMLVDLEKTERSFDSVREALLKLGEELGLSIRIQREEIFMSMHQL